MTLAEKIIYLKKEMGIEYSFIAKKIGSYPDRIYKFTRPKDHELYKNLGQEQLKRLEKYLSGFDFPQK